MGAHQCLYGTRRWQQVCGLLPPAERRPRHDKVLQGCLLVVLFVLLLIFPLLFFSFINPFLYAPSMKSASLSLDLVGGNGTHENLWSSPTQLTMQSCNHDQTKSFVSSNTRLNSDDVGGLQTSVFATVGYSHFYKEPWRRKFESGETV